MPLKNYGVLKGKAIQSRMGAGRSPHYQVHIVSNDTEFRIAINVNSQLSPSELLYLVDENFRHALLEDLADLNAGFSKLASAPGGAAWDFIRGNLFDCTRLRTLPVNIPATLLHF